MSYSDNICVNALLVQPNNPPSPMAQLVEVNVQMLLITNSNWASVGKAAREGFLLWQQIKISLTLKHQILQSFQRQPCKLLRVAMDKNRPHPTKCLSMCLTLCTLVVFWSQYDYNVFRVKLVLKCFIGSRPLGIGLTKLWLSSPFCVKNPHISPFVVMYLI